MEAQGVDASVEALDLAARGRDVPVVEVIGDPPVEFVHVHGVDAPLQLVAFGAQSGEHKLSISGGVCGARTERLGGPCEHLVVEHEVAELSRFLNACKDKEPIFGNLLKRLQNDRAEKELDVQIKLQREMKSSVSAHRRFKILDQELLKGHWFVEPSFGEEHGVGAAYTMFSQFVPPDSPMRAYWRRPLTFSGRGIDSIAQPYGVTSLESEKLESVEYKYKFALTELFNHPLTITKAIVAWEIDAIGTAPDSLQHHVNREARACPRRGRSLIPDLN